MKILIEATYYRNGAQSEYEHQSGLKDFYSTKDPVASILDVWKVTMVSFDQCIMNWQDWQYITNKAIGYCFMCLVSIPFHFCIFVFPCTGKTFAARYFMK